MTRSDNKRDSALLTVTWADSILRQGGEEGGGGTSFPSTATGCRGMASDPSVLVWPAPSTASSRLSAYPDSQLNSVQ